MKLLLSGCVVLCSVVWGFAGDNPRVFVTDSKSWEVSGGAGANTDALGASVSGGARPQTAEIIKTFRERCPSVIVNNKQEKADYIVLLDHEGGKSPVLRDNKVVVFNKEGDSIMSNSTRALGNAVKDACTAISKDWTSSGAKAATEAKPEPEKQAKKAE